MNKNTISPQKPISVLEGLQEKWKRSLQYLQEELYGLHDVLKQMLSYN